MASLASRIASKDFSRQTIAALKANGVMIQRATFVPGPNGSYLNGERAYVIDDNGCGRVLLYLEVLDMSRGELAACSGCDSMSNPATWRTLTYEGASMPVCAACHSDQDQLNTAN